ncbi:hypothetical protein Cni_G16869 [Canna indica]|uniref:Inhibitor I9 domain-containing protein n=1 Tax=Canna indica TaxID=4628 RepID=A0AAQ3KLJ2_9LILI|nr:hypothetical protein Cni_G16869 [Canna indica]
MTAKVVLVYRKLVPVQTYIIQSLDEDSLKIWHKSFLPESADASERLLHSYDEVFNGFATKLTKQEVENIGREGFLLVFPTHVLCVLTTHSHDFLSLSGTIEDEARHGSHTFSTAVGNFVRNVSFYALANGTGAGVAPPRSSRHVPGVQS